jgi:NAD(P)-dependent dehydrogenase (short-subunit alcohol dehydrogenase family)
MKLSGLIALITGGGRGIGQAIAIAFAREGASIAIASRTRSELDDTLSKVKQYGVPALALVADISKPDDVQKIVQTAINEFGRIDILVNCAGVFGPIGPLIKNDTAKWIETININLIGTVLCCKAVLPFMIKNGSGKIINLSGGGAGYPHPYFSAYSTSKAAVVRFTETISVEVKENNIQVNAIAPGGIATKLQDEVLAAGELAGKEALVNAKKIKATGGTPLDKPTSLAVYLASAESNGLTGKLISAVWDDWQNMANDIPKINSTDLYTLRRITSLNDGKNL